MNLVKDIYIYIYIDKKNICKLAKKIKRFYSKNLVDKICKLIIKELKLNVNYPIETSRNHYFLPCILELRISDVGNLNN